MESQTEKTEYVKVPKALLANTLSFAKENALEIMEERKHQEKGYLHLRRNIAFMDLYSSFISEIEQLQQLMEK